MTHRLIRPSFNLLDSLLQEVCITICNCLDNLLLFSRAKESLLNFLYHTQLFLYHTSYIIHNYSYIIHNYSTSFYILSISNNPSRIPPKNKQTNDDFTNISKTLFQIQIGQKYLIPAILALTHDSLSNTTKL